MFPRSVISCLLFVALVLIGCVSQVPESRVSDKDVTPRSGNPDDLESKAPKPILAQNSVPDKVLRIESELSSGFVRLPSISSVVTEVTPWVVSITVETFVRGMFFDFSNEGAGSGFLVRPDGYIVTNNHVIDGATQINVHLPDGETYKARVVGRDEVSDLAVIKINVDGMSYGNLAIDNEFSVGDWVVAIGNALALKGGPTVTVGIVSGVGRTINTERGEFYGLIQTDAAINDGNSGGPLVNLNGEVVGINQAILRQAQGMGFAVSASVATPIINSLIEYGRVRRPLIGFGGVGVTSAIAAELDLSVNEGVIVSTISASGPAYEGGMRRGDVMININGTPTPDVPTWLNLLWSYQIGDKVEVAYIRDKEIFTTTIKLSER